MANKGFSIGRNLPIISNSFGTDDTVSFNICKDTKDIMINIPILNEEEGITNKIGPISLVYSYNDKTINDSYGYGMRIDTFKRIKSVTYNEEYPNIIKSIIIKNEDFTEIEYSSNEPSATLTNDNTDTYIFVEYEKNSENVDTAKEIKLYDNYGNYYVFENVNAANPKYMHRVNFKEDENIVFTEVSSKKYITFNNQKIELSFHSSNYLVDCKFYVDNIEYVSVEFTYLNGLLTNMKKYYTYVNDQNETVKSLIEEKSYILTNTTIEIRNERNGYYSSYQINDGLIVSYTNNYVSKGKTTTIDYDDDGDYTIIRNYNNISSTYFLKDERIVCFKNSEGKICIANYDSNGRIIEKTNLLDCSLNESIKRNNLFPNGYYFYDGTYTKEGNIANSVVERDAYSDDVADLHVYNYGTSNVYVSFVLNDLKIKKNNGYTFLVNTLKDDSEENDPVSFSVCLYNTDENGNKITSSAQYIYVNSLTAYFKKSTAGRLFIAKDDYSNVEIRITVPGNNSDYYISEIQLYDFLYGTINEYNKYGVVSKAYSGDNVSKRSYIKENKTLLLTNKTTDYSSSINSYDKRGNIIEVLNSDGTLVENTYDDNNNITKKVLKNHLGNYMEEAYTYTTDGMKVLSSINNDGNVTNYSYDRNNRILSQLTHSNGLKEEYEYNSDFMLNKHKTIKATNDYIERQYEYLSNNNLKSIKLNNNYSYEFEYDIQGNITKTKVVKGNSSGVVLETNSYEVKNNVYTENLETHMIGGTESSTNKYKYTYDNYNNLTNIYQTSTDGEVLLMEFDYDINHNLIYSYDYKVNEATFYEYNNKNELIKIQRAKNGLITETNYKYDIKGNLLFEENSINHSNVNYYGYNDGNIIFDSPVKLHNYYKNYDDNVYSCFLMTKEEKDNNEIIVKTALSNNTSRIDLTDAYIEPIIECFNDNITKAFKLEKDNNSGLQYIINNDIDDNGRTIAFWFKELNTSVDNDTNDQYNEKYLIQINHIDYDDNDAINFDERLIDVYINENNKIIFKDIETSNINMYQWNFISLTYTFDSDNSVINYSLNLNGNVYNTTSPLINVRDSKKINIATPFNNGNKFNGYVTCILYGFIPLSNNEVYKYYKYSYANYVDYQDRITDNSFNRRIITNRYFDKEDYAIIPLNNSFECINREVEYEFIMDEAFNKDFENLFVYNNNLKSYGYYPNNNKLIYKVDYEDSLSVGIKMQSENIISHQVIFELCNEDYTYFSLYVGADGYIRGNLWDYNFITDKNVSAGAVYNVLTSLALIEADEDAQSYVYKLQIKVNDSEIISYDIDLDLLVRIDRVIIGRRYNGSNSFSFNGLLSSLCISNTVSELSSQSSINKNIKLIKTLNNLSQLKSEELYDDEKHLSTKLISYKDNVVNGNLKCYNIIEKEEFYTNSLLTYSRKIDYYVNDNTGNIERRTLSNNSTCLEEAIYSYDKYGRLVEEKYPLENIRKYYTYDNNGNITKIEEFPINNNTLLSKKEFTYDYSWPNRLLTVNDNGTYTIFSYRSDMPGMISNLSDAETGAVNCFLEWDNSKLSRYKFDDNYYIDYVYNTQGLRTSKVIVDEYAGGNISHTYKYCGNKLIEDEVNDDVKGDYYKLQFLYDESELLYGFKYENKEYYYLRDSLQTIIGIENELKQIVCEYKYDAYGNHKVLDNNRNVSNSKYFIGNINPFRYKGYYYDVETQLFYCNSRYYSPELCRFISPDSIEYLDPKSINGLNLYCYCLNNPISYCDPSGHFILSTILFFTALVLVKTYMELGAKQANNTSDNLNITGLEKFGYSLTGLFIGDFLVSLNNWDEISETITMDPQNEYNFKFQHNPYYSFWNAPLYAIYLKNHQYKDEDSRTTMGLYLELQAHYLFYLIGNEHGKNGAHMGPTKDDPTGNLIESFVSSFKKFLPRLFLW